VIVIAERVDPDVIVDMDRFAEVVLGNARQAASDFRMVDRLQLPARGLLLHTQATVGGLAIESYYGLFAQEPWIFQVVAFSNAQQFSSVAPELATVISSFQAPASE
jgi:hypothetical protein